MLMTALLVQLATVLLLRHRLGKLWLRRPVPLLVLASVVYQGLSPVLLSFPAIGRWDIYRRGVQQSSVDEATLIMSGGMLALTVAYLLTRPERVMAAPGTGDIRSAARLLDWRLLAVACAPLAVLTYEGRGLNNTLAAKAQASLSSNVASTFFVLLVVLTAFGIVLRHGGFLPVLAAQSLVLAAAGERTPVLVAAIAVIVLLAHAGIRPSGAQIRAALGLTAVAMLAITGVRAEQGRAVYNHDSGLGARVSALGGGLAGLGASLPGQVAPGLIAQAASRLDGAGFAGAILQAEHMGQPRLSASYVPESLLEVVPSAAWAAKLSRGQALAPAELEIGSFALQPVNFLPGLPGLYYGFLTVPWLLAFLAGLGLLCGWGERILLASCSAVRLVLLAGSVIAVLDYEKGLPGMLIALRAAVVVAVAVRAVGIVRVRRAREVRPPAPPLAPGRAPGRARGLLPLAPARASAVVSRRRLG